MSITKQQFEQKQLDAKNQGFRKWMQEPMTRALMSTVPACENLEVLLQAAFESGFGSGSGATAVSFLEHMLKGPPR